jgi:GDPmannose 4,6-dehydratase
MWLMLQQETAQDFVLSTNETHSVREFAEKSFAVVGMKIVWQGSGAEEIGICEQTSKVVIRIDPQYYRPTEVDLLLGDSSKARKLLNWKPKVSFDFLVKEMVLADVEKAKRNIAM